MPPSSRLRAVAAAPAAVALLVLAAPSSAAPTLGFVERWDQGTVSTWQSQAANTNPGAGGVDGAADGFLRVARTTTGKLGSHSEGPEYAGDWVNAGINRIRLWLDDVDANQALEIHVAVGNTGNLWMYKTGFSPPENAWGQFTVDLTDSSQFAHIIPFDGQGFTAALRSVDRVLVRHDLAPFGQSPNTIIGEFGIDNLELSNTLIGVGDLPRVAGRPVELAAPYPNPARGAVACAFDTFDGGAVRVSVIDAKGRIVYAETLPAAAPGRRTWMWNGQDARGMAAPAGSYRVRATGAAGGTSRPFVIVR